MLTSVRKFYIFKAGNSLAVGATLTLYVPWLLDLGLTQSQVLLINAAFWFMTFLAEIPTGMLADGRGRGFSLAMGCLGWSAGAFVYFLASGFWSALFAECVLAIGAAFFSGAVNAWMNSAPDRPKDIRPVLSRADQFDKLAKIVIVFASPYATLIHPSGFWLITMSVMILLALFVWCFMHDGGEEHPLSEWEALDEARAHVRASGIAHWNIAFLFVLSTMQWFNLGWAIVSVSFFGKAGLPWMWALIMTPQVIGAEVARRRPEWQSSGGLSCSLALAWLPMLLFFGGSTVPALLTAVVIHEGARGFIWPAHDTYQLRGIPERSQSTVLSIYALADDIMLALWSFIGAIIYDVFEVTSPEATMLSWAVIGIVAMVGAGFLFIFRPK